MEGAFENAPFILFLAPNPFEDKLDRRRRLRSLIFPGGVAFDGEPFATPEIGLPLRMLEDRAGGKRRLASPTGFEPVLPP